MFNKNHKNSVVNQISVIMSSTHNIFYYEIMSNYELQLIISIIMRSFYELCDEDIMTLHINDCDQQSELTWGNTVTFNINNWLLLLFTRIHWNNKISIGHFIMPKHKYSAMENIAQ